MGSVYIANTANTWVDYQVNQQSIQPGRPRPLNGAPAFVTVTRTKFVAPGSFGLGDNTLWAGFRDAVPPEPTACTFEIPVADSVLDDLMLYVFRDFAFLMDTRGTVLQTARPEKVYAALPVGLITEGGGPAAPFTPPSLQEAAMSDEAQEREAVAAGTGNVVVFNCYNEPVSGMLVNNGVPGTGSIGGWSLGGTGSPPLYTPSCLSVPRSKNVAAGNFGSNQGNANKLVVPWVSWTGNATIVIPSDTSLLDDLILFVTLNKAVLMNTRGKVVDTFEVTLSVAAEGEGGREADGS